jgi:GTP-binding protein LepA
LPTANVESVKRQLNALFDFDESEISCISAKSGLGVNEILDLIIEKYGVLSYSVNIEFRVPPPKNIDGPFRALIFDSFFEHFRGAIALILVAEGSVVVGQKIRSFMGQKEYEVAEIGILYPDRVQTKVNLFNLNLQIF